MCGSVLVAMFRVYVGAQLHNALKHTHTHTRTRHLQTESHIFREDKKYETDNVELTL